MGKASLQTVLSRFWAKVDKSGDCWEWTAARTVGYGVLNVMGQATYAHRLSWEIHNGPIPKGLQVLHHCDNRRCVNPSHLFLGTLADNMADMARKGRAGKTNKPRGERHGNAKLTDEAVLIARKDYASGAANCRELAQKHSVSKSVMWAAVRGRTWKHVEMPV